MKAFNGILTVVLGVVALNVPRSALSQISLVSIGRTNDGGYASAVTVSGNYTYLANASDGLRTYDVSNPAHPVRVAQTNNGAAALRSVTSVTALRQTRSFAAGSTTGLPLVSSGGGAQINRTKWPFLVSGIEPAFQFRSALGDGSWKNQGGMEGLFEA
jgi:hypothetical protein